MSESKDIASVEEVVEGLNGIVVDSGLDLLVIGDAMRLLLSQSAKLSALEKDRADCIGMVRKLLCLTEPNDADMEWARQEISAIDLARGAT